MELEGTLLLERSPTRRWISIIAVVIPVASVVMVAAWFVRAYVVPPTITISSPTMTVAAPPAPPVRAQASVVQPQPRQSVAMAEPAAPPPPAAVASPAVAAPPAVTEPPPAVAAPIITPAQQMFATLAVAPPNFNSLTSKPAAFADPSPAAGAAAPPTPEPDIAALEHSAPLEGPVPLPRHKPHVSVALVTGSVPLPRPRPVTEETSAPDLPAYDRHPIE